MELKEVIYIDNLPTIDLHGFDRDYARVKTLEFINDNIKMKNEIICIIHGVGQGIVKNACHEALCINKDVISYKTDNFNHGVTIVNLRHQ